MSHNVSSGISVRRDPSFHYLLTLKSIDIIYLMPEIVRLNFAGFRFHHKDHLKPSKTTMRTISTGESIPGTAALASKADQITQLGAVK
jgi:hypothetical protein